MTTQTRSFPVTTFGYVPREPYLDDALEYARSAIDLDLYASSDQYDAGFSALQNGASNQSFVFSDNTIEASNEYIRKTNLAVQLANSQISHCARFAQIQPKLCRNGQTPVGFNNAITIDEFRNIQSAHLDYLLQAYDLPTNPQSLNMFQSEGIGSGSGTGYKAKLCALFDFLGASRISDYERTVRSRSL